MSPLMLYCLMTWFVYGSDTLSCAKDTQAVAGHIKALHDTNSKTRRVAADELRRIVAKYPSGTVYLASKDGGEAAWQKKVDQVNPGMAKADVLKILPSFADEQDGSEIGSGDSHYVVYRLDYHWLVRIIYRNPDKVIERPVLQKCALGVGSEMAKNFTGTWTTWHVNGEKGYEIQHKNGKYNGVFTRFHDNGAKSFEQHYVDDVSHGTDTGWRLNGELSYTGQYRNGKQDGKWTHWYSNGNRQCETNYLDGKYDGQETRWHENGQIGAVNDYKDGVKHGREASWDESGTLQYDRVFVNGKLVKSLKIVK